MSRYIRPFSIASTPPLKIASNSWVCVKREVCHLFQLVPLRGFGGLPNKRLATFPLIEVASDSWVCEKGEVSFASPSLHSPFSVILPPSAYGLRPSAYSSFFRLETPFLPFFVSLYYTINQLFTYPFYTNRPRFV